VTVTVFEDICSNKHGGDLFSVMAFDRIKAHLSKARREVLDAIAQAGDRGLTCAECAQVLGRGMNAISGRFTELKRDGLIRRSTEQPERPGPTGGAGKIYVAV